MMWSSGRCCSINEIQKLVEDSNAQNANPAAAGIPRPGLPMTTEAQKLGTQGERTSPLVGNYADPDLAIFDRRYFLYPTTDGHRDWAGTTFSAFSSADLIEWHDHGVVLDLANDLSWANSQAWAPAIARKDSKYFLYFTAESNIGVAVGDAPTGPFVDLGRPLVADGDFSGRAIDPSVFIDDDGTPFLLWGNTEAHVVQLSPDMVSFDPSDVVTWTPTDFREAAWVHKRHDVYYLSWSVDDTRDENYRVLYATGDSPYGPWTDRGVLLEKIESRGILATGHHSIVKIPGTDDWLIAYHHFAIPGGDGFHREIAFDRLQHNPQGLIDKVEPSRVPLKIPLT
jgi:beta-xylosidase